MKCVLQIGGTPDRIRPLAPAMKWWTHDAHVSTSSICKSCTLIRMLCYQIAAVMLYVLIIPTTS